MFVCAETAIAAKLSRRQVLQELPPSEWGAAAHAIDAWYMDDSEEDQRLPHRCALP